MATVKGEGKLDLLYISNELYKLDVYGTGARAL